MPAPRRHFGSVRKLPSGRYQASYWHLAVRHPAQQTFETKAKALAWLSSVETDIRRGRWIDPGAGKVLFGKYVDDWLTQRYDIRPRTRELYKSLIACHLNPTFEKVALTDITTASIRRWRATVATDQPTTAAKAYRLLRAVLMTATSDGLIQANPCVIKRAGLERAPERKVPSLDTVAAIADAVGPRYRALVYSAALAGLRAGELSGLERRHVDVVHRTITVEQQAQVVVGQGRVLGPPKSEAGRRTVTMPTELSQILDAHLSTYVDADPSAVVFTRDKGAPITTQHWSKKFREAADGATELHFHDLRHLAGTLAAATGASTRELMARLGHSTPRASLIYQHATEQRDRQIAAGIDAILEAAKQKRREPQADIVDLERSRTNRARIAHASPRTQKKRPPRRALYRPLPGLS
jgi:integrase